MRLPAGTCPGGGVAKTLTQFGQPLADPHAVRRVQVTERLSQLLCKIAWARRAPAQQGTGGDAIDFRQLDESGQRGQDRAALEAANRFRIDADLFGDQFLGVAGRYAGAGERFAELLGEVLFCGQGGRVNMTCGWSTRMLARPGSLRNNMIC